MGSRGAPRRKNARRMGGRMEAHVGKARPSYDARERKRPNHHCTKPHVRTRQNTSSTIKLRDFVVFHVNLR